MKRDVAVGVVVGLAALIGLDPGTGLAMSAESHPIEATLASAVAHAPTTTVVTSDRNPAQFGTLVQLRATVTAASGIPTGTVDVVDGVTTICEAAVLVEGVASCRTRLRPDAHPLTAIYSGDANFSASGSAPLAQTVRGAGTVDTG